MAIQTMESKTATPVQGRRLLPSWIDKVARDDPTKSVISIPRSANLADGFQDITYQQLAGAIDSLAWWIETIIGISSVFETVAYLGRPDLRYNIVPVALIKTGHKMLSMSPRNSIVGHGELMKKTDCTILLHSGGPGIDELIVSRKMTAFRIPELDELLSAQGILPYPYDKTFDEAQSDPIMIVHTSGSAGLPKPIIWTHSLYATVDAHAIPPSLDGRDNMYTAMSRCKRHYSTMPAAHSSSLVRFLRAVLLGVTLVCGPDQYIGSDAASVECVTQVLGNGEIDAANFLPGTLEALCKNTDSLERLKKLRFIGWGGGPLSREAGDILARDCSDTVFHNSLGSSDGGTYVTYRTDPEDWEYICYCPKYNGIEWREHSDGLFELVVAKDPALDLYQGPFKSHSKMREWSSKDLYSKHPTKANHWRFEARTDDLIVLSNGAKFNPSRLQCLVEEHPAVRSSLMTGGPGRLRPALLVELREPQMESTRKNEVFEEVWAIVSKENETNPFQGRVLKLLVLILSSEKPFPRANKGTIQRAAAVQSFQPELDELYRATEQ